MEVVSVADGGSAIQVKPGQTRELGRGNGLNSSDTTVSRRQVSFFVPRVTNNEEILLRFEVLGRNPIYVSRDGKVKVFRRFERGEMGNGDMFCVSAKNPVWYTLRKIENCGEDLTPLTFIAEFGFLVIGHEFDSYPTKMIRDIKNWDWFLEEARKDSDDDEDDNEGKKGKRSVKRKRKKGVENEDEEWMGESEDEKVLVNKSKGQKGKYITRSKDRGKMSEVTSKSKSPIGNRIGEVDDEDEEEDDDDEVDETLGGFIVGDENLEDEEEIDDGDEDEDEEEFADEEEDE
ncbi:hypothetical protein MIMGU_mgv1a011229mg [Erythranthe guttata]|uniref:Uncharacterized protein n=1 Tax=Erythranthe guttata TaxID=4155 RepID=A0A022S1U2_ERYGU|nr:hypothetical protein MIMGU_mgv1a011229mg [Erythranthe guttata]